MANRTSPQRRVPQGQRRKRAWARRNFSDASLTTTTESFDLLSDFTADYGVTATPPGTTLGGLLLDYSITQEVTRATSLDALFVGIRIVDESTLTEVDGPLLRQHADWLWYQMFAFNGTAAGSTLSTASTLGGPLRIHSKRRMDELQMKLVMSFTAIGATTYSARISSSALLILP